MNIDKYKYSSTICWSNSYGSFPTENDQIREGIQEHLVRGMVDNFIETCGMDNLVKEVTAPELPKNSIFATNNPVKNFGLSLYIFTKQDMIDFLKHIRSEAIEPNIQESRQ